MLVVECRESLSQSMRGRLESRARVVSNEASEAAVTLLLQPERTVKRVEAVDLQLGRVADVVQIGGCNEYAAVVNVHRPRDVVRARGDPA